MTILPRFPNTFHLPNLGTFQWTILIRSNRTVIIYNASSINSPFSHAIIYLTSKPTHWTISLQQLLQQCWSMMLPQPQSPKFLCHLYTTIQHIPTCLKPILQLNILSPQYIQQQYHSCCCPNFLSHPSVTFLSWHLATDWTFSPQHSGDADADADAASILATSRQRCRDRPTQGLELGDMHEQRESPIRKAACEAWLARMLRGKRYGWVPRAERVKQPRCEKHWQGAQKLAPELIIASAEQALVSSLRAPPWIKPLSSRAGTHTHTSCYIK